MSRNMAQAEADRYRAAMYRFLSRIFIQEVDEELLGQMKAFVFPKNPASADLKAGYALFADCVAGYEACDITDLEADYAAVFLAAGMAQGPAAFPYESVYTDKNHLTGQEAGEDVHILYAAKGLKPREDMYRIPDDHVGLEFAYMARLCEDAAKASADGNDAVYGGKMAEQKNFFDAHIRRWVPIFAEDVAKYAETQFYQAIAKITRGFVREEAKWME